ncbi:MAG: hypothetical protein CI952_1610, partial [Methanohalophilus sp.]
LQVYPGISGVLVSHPDECLIDIQAPCRKGGVVDAIVWTSLKRNVHPII